MTDVLVSIERLDNFFRLAVIEEGGHSCVADFNKLGTKPTRAGECDSDGGATTQQASVLSISAKESVAPSNYKRVNGEYVNTGRVVLDKASFSWDYGHTTSGGIEDSVRDKDLNADTEATVSGAVVMEYKEGYKKVEIELADRLDTSTRTFLLSELTLRTIPGELIAVIGSTGVCDFLFLLGL